MKSRKKNRKDEQQQDPVSGEEENDTTDESDEDNDDSSTNDSDDDVRHPSALHPNDSSSSDEESLSSQEESKLFKSSLPLRDKCFLTLDIPGFSPIASLYSFINLSAILISTICFLVSTLPEYHDGLDNTLLNVECFVVSLFTFDYASRFVLTRQARFKFMCRFQNLVDFFGLVPFYVELLITNESSSGVFFLRILRLIRIIRVFKLVKYSKQLPIVIRATKASRAGFGLAIFSITLFVILWASALYYAELGSCQFDTTDQLWRYDDGRQTPFQSIPHSLWWAIVTMSTTGYGDDVPQTAAGKAIGSGAIISGVLVLAFPLTILSGNFASEYNNFLRSEERKVRKRLWREYRKGNIGKEPISTKVILKNIWNEMLTLRGGLDSTKSVMETFERQFFKIDLYVQRLERVMAKDMELRFESENKKTNREMNE